MKKAGKQAGGEPSKIFNRSIHVWREGNLLKEGDRNALAFVLHNKKWYAIYEGKSESGKCFKLSTEEPEELIEETKASLSEIDSALSEHELLIDFFMNLGKLKEKETGDGLDKLIDFYKGVKTCEGMNKLSEIKEKLEKLISGCASAKVEIVVLILIYSNNATIINNRRIQYVTYAVKIKPIQFSSAVSIECAISAHMNITKRLRNVRLMYSNVRSKAVSTLYQTSNYYIYCPRFLFLYLSPPMWVLLQK